MPLYSPASGSLGNNKHQTPNFTAQYSFADCPTGEVISQRCSHVTVNKVGTYAFLYETTSSLGTAPDYKIETYLTGSVVQHAQAGGIKLDINPIAWRRIDDDEADGDVTFIYVRRRN